MTSDDRNINSIKANYEYIVYVVLKSCSAIKNRRGFTAAERLLNQYYRDDPEVKSFIEKHRF